jgi:hypothetical protein
VYLSALSTDGVLRTLQHYLVDNLEWTKNWLIATVIDYYGAATCLCVIALLSEPMLQGLAWSTGFLLLGSPICCLYCIYRWLIRQQTVDCSQMHLEVALM